VCYDPFFYDGGYREPVSEGMAVTGNHPSIQQQFSSTSENSIAINTCLHVKRATAIPPVTLAFFKMLAWRSGLLPDLVIALK
jgi:hypothetical protein